MTGEEYDTNTSLGGVMIDLVLNYRCQVQCDYCTQDPAWADREMSTAQAKAHLAEGRKNGFDAVRFSGGEPTMRRDIFELGRFAREIGYTARKLHTNGLLCVYPRFVTKLVQAGFTHVNVSVMGHDSRLYRETMGLDRGWEFVSKGLENLAPLVPNLAVDVVMRKAVQGQLPDILKSCADRGARSFNLWLVSLTGYNARNVDSLPRGTALAPEVLGCFRWGRENGYSVMSYHLPYCWLPGYEDHVWKVLEKRIMVIDPSESFLLRDSQLTGCVHVEACAECRWRDECPGLRPDYLQQHGEGEVRAVPAP